MGIMHVTLQPGWKWSKDVKPIAKTDSCQAPHLNYMISGRMHVVMDDGTEEDFGPGDIAVIPPGHDAWVVSDEPVVTLDVTGSGVWAKPS
jgi:quercetin dioxygenase-like cupin family protein